MNLQPYLIGLLLLTGCSGQFDVYNTPQAYLPKDMYPSEFIWDGNVIVKLVHHVTKDECTEEFGAFVCIGELGTIEDYVYVKNGVTEPCYNTYQFKAGDDIYIVSDLKLISKDEFISRCLSTP